MLAQDVFSLTRIRAIFLASRRVPLQFIHSDHDHVWRFYVRSKRTGMWTALISIDRCSASLERNPSRRLLEPARGARAALAPSTFRWTPYWLSRGEIVILWAIMISRSERTLQANLQLLSYLMHARAREVTIFVAAWRNLTRVRRGLSVNWPSPHRYLTDFITRIFRRNETEAIKKLMAKSRWRSRI